MAIANTLRRYLDDHHIEYEVITHIPTTTSARTAQVSHVSGDSIAKGVVVRDEENFVLAVVPATHHVRLEELGRCLDRIVGLAREEDTGAIFRDCDYGAIPPVGSAYGIEVIVDTSLDSLPDVYFEGGDHESLVHVTHDQFERLMEDAGHGHFSHHD